MRINSITNSQQRNQQKQQAFGAFKYTQPIAELLPIIKRAQKAGISVVTPDDIIAALKNKDNFLAGIVFTPKTKEIFKQITSGHLFNASEQARMIEEAECGFGNVRLEAEEIMKTATRLPITDLIRSTAAIEVETRENVMVRTEINELESRLRAARSRQENAMNTISDENSKLAKLGF